jgi:hypothetical protein
VGDAIQVDGGGLIRLASQCDAAAAALTRSATPSLAGLPVQATVTAVGHGHGLVEAAATVLAARITATGTKLRLAATSYTSTDGGSADQIGAVGV